MASVRQQELHSRVYDIFSAPKTLLKTKVKLEDFPLSGPERFRLSKSMSVTELLTATDFHEDEEAKEKLYTLVSHVEVKDPTVKGLQTEIVEA